MEIRRDKHSPKAYVWALETITPGSELTVHYGPDYWQEHFFSCPDPVQQAAAQCYSLVVVNGKCFQTKELRKLRAQGQAYQFRGMWFLGPRARPPTEAPSPPSRPRPACNPLPLQALPFPSPPALGPPARTPPPPPTTHPVPGSSPLPIRSSAVSSPSSMTFPPAPQDDPVPFLWLMDLYSSIIEHSVQATWGVSALMVVATFLHDPANRTMGALLSWASAFGSPARFHLHHASSAHPPPALATSPLELLAADYGMKARSASGLRSRTGHVYPFQRTGPFSKLTFHACLSSLTSALMLAR